MSSLSDLYAQNKKNFADSDVNKTYTDIYNRNKKEYSTNWNDYLTIKTVYEATQIEKPPEKPVTEPDKNMTKYQNTETISFYFLAIVYLVFFYITYLFYDNLVTNTLAKLLSLNSASINFSLIMKRCFLFLWIFVFLFIFIVGIIYLSIMKGTQGATASKNTAMCILGIVGGTFLLVNSNLFIKIFENTVGYGWINITASKDVDNIMNLLIKHKEYENKQIFPETKLDLGFLLSIFRIDNFENVLNDIKDSEQNKYDFHLRNNESMLTEFNKMYSEDRENIYLKSIEKELKKMNSNTSITDVVVNDLAKLVIRKNTIGHLCWIYFSGIVSTVVSMKYLYKHL